MGSYDVPEDVVIKILTLLPVISLMRFKCVCKSWRALVESPSFIARHLNLVNNSNKGNDNLLLMLRPQVKHKYDFFFLSDETFEVTSNVGALPSPLFNGENEGFKLQILASCNGIVCVDDESSGSLALWNPATREFRILPEPGIPRKEIYDCHVGFGFDLKTNDYKVVRMVFEKKISEFHYNNYNHPVEIYSLNSDSWRVDNNYNHPVEIYSLNSDSWRVIDENNIPANIPKIMCRIDYCTMTYVNGMFSWWSPFGRKLEEVLVSFDMSDEVFVMTLLPEACNESIWKRYHKDFFVLNESVAFIFYQFKDHYEGIMEEQWFEIWVLNEYGAQDSWTKLYKIHLSYDMTLYPLGFSKNGNLFFRDLNFEDTDDREGLILYDPFSGEIKKRLHGFDGVSPSLCVLYYKESIVSIKGGGNASINGPAPSYIA